MTKAQQATAAVVPAAEASVIGRTANVIAAEIRFIDTQARQYVLQSAIEIGQKLTEAKALVAHGEWGGWLKANVNYSQSTANNFMRVADEYDSTPQALANLNYTQAVALLAVPAEEREKFAEENNAAEMSSRELQAAIKERNDLQKKLEEEKKLQAEQKAQYDQWAQKQAQEKQALYDHYQTEVKLRQEQEQQLTDLQSELEKAKADGDEKAAAKIKAELRKAEKAKSEQEKKVAELQTQLEEQKAAMEKEVAERLQKREQELVDQAVKEKQELNQQLEKLNQQLSRANNESFLKAKIQIEQIVRDGDLLVKAIAAVTEPEEQAKLKTAASQVIDKLRGLL